MLKNNQKRSLCSTVFLVLFFVGIFFAGNSTEASVVCKKYKEHKKEYKTEKNKEIFFKIKWVKHHQPEIYSHYRLFCEPYRFNHNYFFGELKKTCHEYYIYEEYSDYLEYKRQCKKHHDDEENPVPEPEPEPQPN